MTPEGKVKAKINKALAKFTHLYKFMPVPGGYGPSSLDYLICYKSQFIAIEAKAPGKVMTPRQGECSSNIILAGGIVFVVSDDKTLAEVINYLEGL